MGQTSLAQLAALLQRCRLLVTNDTGTMHLACAVGTQVVGLFMGPALFHQTGPYGVGHVVLQAEIPCAPCGYLVRCSHQVCKDHIPWKAVFDTVKWMVETFNVQRSTFNVEDAMVRNPPPQFGSGLAGYISMFDADGYLQFQPLHKRRLDWSTLLRLAYRGAWKVLLDGKPLDQVLAAMHEEIATYYHGERVMDDMQRLADEVLKTLARLHSLAQQGSALSQELVQEAGRQPFRIGRIQALGKALEELDEQIKVLGATREEVRPITIMFRFGKENLQGWELLPLSKQTRQLYDTLGQQSEVSARVLAACTRMS
jgi:hypothetical protein